jgi:hypothetical protein
VTGGERKQVEDGRAGGQSLVVVVASDATRQQQYEAALRVTRAQAVVTLDPDEAATILEEYRPGVLVLDQGLPRLALFRLYGAAREDERTPAIRVVFVGQDDDTGPDDYYLPGEPSPSRVAATVSALVGRGSAAGARAGDAVPDSAPTPVAVPDPVEAQPAREEGSGTVVVPVAPVVEDDEDDEPAPVAAPAEAPRKPGRRLDVILVRVGLVLLIIGGLLFLLNMQVNQGSLIAPTPAPSLPTRRPSPSPSPRPAAHLDVLSVDRAVD